MMLRDERARLEQVYRDATAGSGRTHAQLAELTFEREQFELACSKIRVQVAVAVSRKGCYDRKSGMALTSPPTLPYDPERMATTVFGKWFKRWFDVQDEHYRRCARCGNGR